jgi:hypothetical protein
MRKMGKVEENFAVRQAITRKEFEEVREKLGIVFNGGEKE